MLSLSNVANAFHIFLSQLKKATEVKANNDKNNLRKK